MKRILIINSLYNPYIGGGAEIICQEQAEKLAQKGYSIRVLTTSDNPGITNDIVNGIPVYRAHIENIYWHYSQNRPNKYIRLLWHLKDIYNWKMKKYIRQVIYDENLML